MPALPVNSRNTSTCARRSPIACPRDKVAFSHLPGLSSMGMGHCCRTICACNWTRRHLVCNASKVNLDRSQEARFDAIIGTCQLGQYLKQCAARIGRTWIQQGSRLVSAGDAARSPAKSIHIELFHFETQPADQ